VTLEVRRQCGPNDPRGALEIQRGTIDAIADHRLLQRVLGGVWEDGCGHGTTIQSVDNWDVPHANLSSPRCVRRRRWNKPNRQALDWLRQRGML